MYIIITKNQSIINLARTNGDQIIKLNSKNEEKKDLFSSINTIKENVNEFLLTIGIPANIQGFYYLQFIFEELLMEPELKLQSITKNIYPCIAKKFNSKSSCIERCIRHAIDIAFDRGSQKLQEKVFGYTTQLENCKPTNSEFIFGSLNYLNRLIKN